MDCASCYGSGYQTCNQCGGSGADGCVCANGQVICNMCGGSGRTAEEAPKSSSRAAGKANQERGSVLLTFILTFALSTLLGGAGVFIFLMIWSIIGGATLIQWLLSLGRKKNAPKLD